MSWLPGLGLVACLAAALRGVTMIRDRGPVGRFAAAAEELSPASTLPRRSPLGRIFEAVSARYGAVLARGMSERRRTRVSHLLDAAGRPGGLTLEGYMGRKLAMTMVLGAIGVLAALAGTVALLPVLLIVGWFVTDLLLIQGARARQARIARDLPDFLDVLAVSVGAGIAFRPGMRRVAEELAGPVGEEVLTALRQMDLGATRREALEALRDRNDSEALGVLVSGILQAEELGVPLAGALVDQAADMRRAAYQRARRQAQRAAPRVSLIVAGLIVPAAILLIAAAMFLGSGIHLGSLVG